MTEPRRNAYARSASLGFLLVGAGNFVALTVTGALPLLWAIPLLMLVAFVGYALLLAWDVFPVPEWMLRGAREELRSRGEWTATSEADRDTDQR